MAHMDTAEVSLEQPHSDSRVESFVDGRRWTEACHVHLGRSCVGLIRGANSRVFAVSSVWHTLRLQRQTTLQTKHSLDQIKKTWKVSTKFVLTEVWVQCSCASLISASAPPEVTSGRLSRTRGHSPTTCTPTHGTSSQWHLL